jgi:anaerobic selenocysteine-containing dehydrogenase
VHGVGGDRVPATYGVDEPAGCYDDLDECRRHLCWGNNPAEMHPVLFSRLIDREPRREGHAHRHDDAAHPHQRLRRRTS